MGARMVTIIPRVGSASGRRTGWVKLVRGIVAGATGAKRYNGPYLRSGHESEVPVGSVLLRVDPMGSVRNGYQVASVWTVAADGSLSCRGDELDWWRQQISIRDLIERHLAVESAQGETLPPLGAEALPLAWSEGGSRPDHAFAVRESDLPEAKSWCAAMRRAGYRATRVRREVRAQGMRFPVIVVAAWRKGLT